MSLFSSYMAKKGLLGILAGISLLIGTTIKSQDLNYERAVSNESYRPEFIQSLDLRGLPKNVTNISYSTENNGTCAVETKVKTVFLGESLEPANTEMVVFPYAFSNSYIKSSEDLTFCLVSHEGTHSKIYAEGARKIIPLCTRQDGSLDTELVNLVSELEATSNEINLLWETDNNKLTRNPDKLNISREYAIHALNYNMDIYTKLSELEKSENHDSEKVKKLLKAYSLPVHTFCKGKENGN